MKVIEHVFERRIREKVKIDAMMQFGFWPGKGTTDAIFTVQQMQEKYTCKGKKLYFAFVDLEKVFDRVPREVTRWTLRKAGVEEWLVKAVTAMHEGAQTVVRTTEGDSKEFNVKVGLHQDRVEENGNWPCGVCKKGVGNNLILCHSCKKSIHKRCSGVKGSLRNASQSLICRG